MIDKQQYDLPALEAYKAILDREMQDTELAIKQKKENKEKN